MDALTSLLPRAARPGDGRESAPRLLCYLHSFATGGVERTALRLCRAWADDGLDVEVVVGRAEGHVPDRDLRSTPGAAWLPFRWLPHPGLSTARFETLWMLLWLPREIRSAAPDILFCPGNTYSVVAVWLRLRLGRRCPPIVAKISNDLDRRDLPLPVRWLYHRWCRLQGLAIHHFVVLSEAVRAEAQQRLGVPSSRIDVIPNPVVSGPQVAALARAGAEARRTRPQRSPGRRFLTIGRLEQQKNLALLIRAFARGAAPDDRLVILGEGRQRARLERLVLRLGLAHRVVLPGHSARIEDWIARSDMFVLSSDFEGLPASLIEALAAGLPVIATDCCRSMAETLAGTARARLVPVRDEAALTRAIAEFDPPYATDAADLVPRFRVETSSRGYRRLFDRILGEAHRRAATPPPSSPFPDGVDCVHPSFPSPRDDLAARGAGRP